MINNLLKFLLPTVFTNFFTPGLGGAAAAVSIVNGVDSFMSDGGGGSSGSSASGTYDPYASSRAQWIEPLNNLVNNPASIMESPLYRTMLNQGKETTIRGLAKTGQTQSGQEQIALNALGMNTANQWYNQQLATLMQLSGASQNPAAAAAGINAASQQGWLQQQQGLANISGGLGALNTLYGGGGSSWNSTPGNWNTTGSSTSGLPSYAVDPYSGS